MPKQASKVCFSLFLVLSMLANYTISADPLEQYAPTASESENKPISSESYFSVPPSANIPDVKTESNQTLTQENVSTLSNANESSNLEGEQNFFDQQLAPSPSVYTNNIVTSPSPSIVDNSVLYTRDMDNVSQENTSVPLSKADSPSAGTEKSSFEDLFQANTSLPPSPSAETETSSSEDLLQENTSLPPSPSVETKQDEVNTLVPSSSPPSLTPAYIDTPAFETSDDGGFTQENHSPPPSNIVSVSPEAVPQLNDYSSLPNDIVPSPSEALSYPELDPTIQLTPTNDDTFDSAPTSNEHTILPSNYRAEDEPVEPYEEEEDSWNGVNGAVAGVLVGACVIGVGGFVYQKRKKDTVRAQYESLA